MISYLPLSVIFQLQYLHQLTCCLGLPMLKVYSALLISLVGFYLSCRDGLEIAANSVMLPTLGGGIDFPFP